MEDANFSKVNLLKGGRTPSLPFLIIKNDVLGKSYNLSLVICGNETSHKINRETRKKDYPTNVLSFPLEKKSGEIFLDIEKIKTETEKFEMPYKDLLIYLFIHGLLHLKGYDHGEKMEKLEKKFLKKYKMS